VTAFSPLYVASIVRFSVFLLYLSIQSKLHFHLPLRSLRDAFVCVAVSSKPSTIVLLKLIDKCFDFTLV
jgi:hypothetical protein